MRELGLEPCQPRPWRVSLTEGDGQEHNIPDLVDRDFTAEAPGEKMVGDITYISTWEGWLFLATVIDCHTKAVIGWAVDNNYKTPLIEKAIEMAARNYPLAENAIFHSDRGSNYTSQQFAVTLKRHGLRQSAGRTGICYDNAMAESFFAALKNECVYRTEVDAALNVHRAKGRLTASKGEQSSDSGNGARRCCLLKPRLRLGGRRIRVRRSRCLAPCPAICFGRAQRDGGCRSKNRVSDGPGGKRGLGLVGYGRTRLDLGEQLVGLDVVREPRPCHAYFHCVGLALELWNGRQADLSQSPSVRSHRSPACSVESGITSPLDAGHY